MISNCSESVNHAKNVEAPSTRTPNSSSLDRMPVPEEDLRAALTSIEKTFHNSLSSQSLHDNLVNTLNNLESSLKSRIEDMVTPIPADEYETKFIPFSTPIRKKFYCDSGNIDTEKIKSNDSLDDTMNCENTDDESTISISSESFSQDDMSSEENESDYDLDTPTANDTDDDEFSDDGSFLLDQDALKRVKLLRASVRDAAERNKKIRDEQLLRMVNLVSAHQHKQQIILAQMNDKDTTQTSTEDSSTPNPSSEKKKDLKLERTLFEDDGKQQIANSHSVQKMKSTLRELISSLVSIDVDLPDRIDMLKDTTDTIKEHLCSRNNLENNETSNNDDSPSKIKKSLSRIEVAITSRENHCTKEDNKFINSESTTEDNVLQQQETNKNFFDAPPEKRFANFLSGLR
mmetsp:Transcript_18535/g.26086  ORF Transcript_18535/g.26086 Transcript_18535/m.26086 type:complete len:403 (-) Transcript_18535:588-1796(-)